MLHPPAVWGLVVAEREQLAANLAPDCAAQVISAFPVSRRVNDPKNDDVKLIEPEPA